MTNRYGVFEIAISDVYLCKLAIANVFGSIMLCGSFFERNKNVVVVYGNNSRRLFLVETKCSPLTFTETI